MTTLDYEKQQAAEKAVREGAERNAKISKASNAALVSMDPKTGEILAMVGSKDYFDTSIDGNVNVALKNNVLAGQKMYAVRLAVCAGRNGSLQTHIAHGLAAFHGF